MGRLAPAMSLSDGSTAEPLLEVRGLRVSIRTRAGLVQVVDGIDLNVAIGEVAGIAGESGSGKTLSMMAVLGLLPEGSRVSGQARFRGQDLLRAAKGDLGKHHGKDIGLVMQDSHSSLHPMLSVGSQLTDHVQHHLGISGREARVRAIELLRRVQIPDPHGAVDAYPHQFSGGMRQRIAIAIALACGPSLLIADEPTTGLDVTVQAGILHLLNDLRQNDDLAIILITHDLGVMSALADTVTVMYAGRVAEAGPTREVLASPRHPYTAALLDALPQPSGDLLLRPIPGQLGPPNLRPTGCAFHPRCSYARPSCSQVVPTVVDIGDGRVHSCLVDPFATHA